MIPEKYQQALDYLYSLIDFETKYELRSSILYDLRRMARLLEICGSPHLERPTVHIAGTKGKGSTAVMIAGILTSSGYATGLYTSPHLLELAERIKIDGIDISSEYITSLVDELKPVIESMNAAPQFGRLTTFEVLTAMAFVYFSRAGARFQVIETGLGGRLDATNVVSPKIAVITSIGLDHTAVLGTSIELIAREKAGIIKPGCTVVMAPQAREAESIISQKCTENGARLVRSDRTRVYCSGYDGGFQQLKVTGKLGTYEIDFPLLASYQHTNVACAVTCAELLIENGYSLGPGSIERGLRQVKWPGRFQIVSSSPLIIVDGAHNPGAVLTLLSSIDRFTNGRRIGKRTLVFGTSVDKDIEGMVACLRGNFDRVIVTSSSHPRAMTTARIASEFGKYNTGCVMSESVEAAIEKARSNSAENDLVVVTGSLFVAGDSLRSFKPGR